MTSLNVVGFVAKGRKEDNGILAPVLVKLAIFTMMITLAMILVYTEEKWIGIIVYIKEVVEFALFIYFLKKRRSR